MRMNVICFGDSNTYGYDPRSYLGDRYDADSRWVDILATATGWIISNMGRNGREIPSAAPAFPTDTDLLIVMLGTNDLLQGRSPEKSAERLERFLSGLSLDQNKILLIAPPPVTLGAWVPSAKLIDDSRTFARLCQTLAERMGIRFADSGNWDIPLAYDGVHFTEQGTKPLPPDFWRNSNGTNSACTLISSAVDWVRRKLRGWIPANHPGGGQRDDGHPGSHHPGCAGAG